MSSEHSVSAQIDLYYDLHVPEDAANSPLLISIHGYAAHKTYMMREAKLIAPKDFVIASLQGPNRFWREAGPGDYRLAFGWLSDYRPEEQVALHHEFILKVIDRLSYGGIVDRSKVFLYGFSQACALNFRFAFSNPDALRGIAGVCGGIPSDMDTNDMYSPSNADVQYLYGDEDIFYSNEKFAEFDNRLADYLPSYSSKKYKAKHEITNEMRTDLRNWLQAVSDQ